MTQAHILILHVGGTIGMEPSTQGYAPVAGFAARLEAALATQPANSLPTYTIIESERLIDSANLHPSDWLNLADTLAAHWQQYDGFIILHGTDTMAYTASMLSFMLRGIDKPVLFTGSQIPLASVRSDALNNVVTSLQLAASSELAEVGLCFNGKLLRGNRSTKLKSMALDAFHSPQFPYLADAAIELKLHTELLLKPGTPDFNWQAFNPEAVVIAPMFPRHSSRRH